MRISAIHKNIYFHINFQEIFWSRNYANDNFLLLLTEVNMILYQILILHLNQWHNLVATHLGDGEMKVYLNGEMIFTNDVNSPNNLH